jgi:CBS domain-containing protein
MEQLLGRTGVRGLMDRHLAEAPVLIIRNAAEQILNHHPHWILLRDSQQLLQPADLATYLQKLPESGDSQITEINLQEIPARRYDLARIPADANLYEALELMNRRQVDVLWVESLTDDHQPLGIISREKIDSYYRI